MAKYAYRCQACRKRHMFNRPLEDYITKQMMHTRKGKSVKIWAAKRCECGSARFYWDKERNLRMFAGVDPRGVPCRCSSYHHPHRPGSRYCEQNWRSEYNIRTGRQGEEASEVRFDMAFENGGTVVGPSDPCPF